MKADLDKIIEDIVRNQFAGSQIDAVHVEEDTDFDGDRILRVTVVYNSPRGLDPVKAKGLVRHMRSSLSEGNSFTFPIVAFRSRADEKRLKSAAA